MTQIAGEAQGWISHGACGFVARQGLGCMARPLLAEHTETSGPLD